MIKIYLLDFNGAEADKNYLSALAPYVRETKNEKQKRERVFSYELLRRAYEDLFSEKMPEILRDENGRPYFSSGDVDFNLSHDGEMAALILSDEGRCGIDIQRTGARVSDRLIKKTEKKYEENKISDLIKNGGEIDRKIFIYTVSDNGEISPARNEAYEISESNSEDFFTLWTDIEAVSKADGGGLSLLGKADLSGKFSFLRLKVKDKKRNEYALCACKISNS